MKKLFSFAAYLAVLFLFCGCAVKPGLVGNDCRNDALGHPCQSDMVLEYTGFTLGYSVFYRQALWASYILAGENLRHPVTGRTGQFVSDPQVPQAVKPSDYRNSGYDRGHLVPAADVAYSVTAMRESFLMTNISPQFPECNRRVWLDVEKLVRKWALKEEFLYVVTGPYFTGQCDLLSAGGVVVPTGFFKAVLDLTEPYKMIAVYVTHERSGGEVRFMTVDELENMLGYDFFDRLDDELENELESRCDWEIWEVQTK